MGAPAEKKKGQRERRLRLAWLAEDNGGTTSGERYLRKTRARDNAKETDEVTANKSRDDILPNCAHVWSTPSTSSSNPTPMKTFVLPSRFRPIRANERERRRRRRGGGLVVVVVLRRSLLLADLWPDVGGVVVVVVRVQRGLAGDPLLFSQRRRSERASERALLLCVSLDSSLPVEPASVAVGDRSREECARQPEEPRQPAARANRVQV